jgi:hypothetical protein
MKRAITLAKINHMWNRYNMCMLRSWPIKIPNMNKMRRKSQLPWEDTHLLIPTLFTLFMPLRHVKSHYNLILYYTSTYVEQVGVSQHDNVCSFIESGIEHHHPNSNPDNVVTKMIWIMQWYCWNEWIVDDVFVDVDVTLLWVGRNPWHWTSLSKESLCFIKEIECLIQLLAKTNSNYCLA